MKVSLFSLPIIRKIVPSSSQKTGRYSRALQSDVFERSRNLQDKQNASEILAAAGKFAPENYFSLSAEQKDIIKRTCSEEIVEAADDNIKMGLGLKKMLDERYGEDGYVFVSIGTSPAGVGRVMEFSGVETKYLPISGLRCLHKPENITVEDDKFKEYKKFLEKQGLSKSRIKNDKKIFYFTDYTATGTTLNLFHYIMKHKFGISSKNIQYMSFNKELSDSFSNNPQNQKQAERYIEKYLNESLIALYSGVPHLSIECIDRVNVCPSYQTESTKRYNFLIMDNLYNKGLLRANQANKTSL